MVSNNRPVKTYKAGVISISVWENELEDGKKINSYSLKRVYKDDNDEWKEASSFRTNDLPKLRALLDKAYLDNILIEE